MLKLHLVGGFLGSGKTTAIIQASRLLMERGMRVGVVTNDQGRFLVDTAFMRLSNLPTVEVTGGCFCCNYPDLDHSLDHLLEVARPDVIFAESVGSCADLVATVLNPLLQFKKTVVSPTSFSVFADGRLLRRRLRGDPMPFSEDVVYIYDKQLEEAGVIILNKADLITDAAKVETMGLLRERYPKKPVLAQSSISASGVAGWMAMLDEGKGLFPGSSLDLDYSRYGRGEARLAWLDEEIIFEGVEAVTSLRKVIRGMMSALQARQMAIGHLKFIIQSDDADYKLSFTAIETSELETDLPELTGDRIRLLVNARVEMGAQELRDLFRVELENAGGNYVENGVNYFHPKQPKPTHRIS